MVLTICLCFLSSKLFDTIRADNPRLLDKLIPIAGDVSEANLGLSQPDLGRICDEVSVVFHCAACIKFDEALRYLLGGLFTKCKVIISYSKTISGIECCEPSTSHSFMLQTAEPSSESVNGLLICHSYLFVFNPFSGICSYKHRICELWFERNWRESLFSYYSSSKAYWRPRVSANAARDLY